ncbi:transmembrane amino acid transporter protein-domain-containing protein [Endogone sp. FLAS-F59071]|nr:transmembrane amino acid transporter protein-domain-containing protein [Endogone sp. FLAS-F59071]|eukprot:RUS14561.1 transmembrane amino acid transporter protein-domain-containing protein [Endogone sp. FLAS-F59071]
MLCVMGGETLWMPLALKHGGWITCAVLAVACSMSIYTSYVLARCQYYDGVKRLGSIKEVATAALGKVGGWLCFTASSLVLLATPAAYILWAAQSMNRFLIGTAGELSVAYWVIICSGVVSIPFVLTKTMKQTAITSCLAVLATFVAIVIVFSCSFVDLPTQHNTRLVVNWSQLPLALSTAALSFGGHAAQPHVEGSMHYPKSWIRVIAAALCTCLAFNLFVAVPCYFVYGDTIVGPMYDSLHSVGAGTAAAAMATAFALLAAPTFMTAFAIQAEEMLMIPTAHLPRTAEFTLRTGFRICIVACLGTLVIYVPHFINFAGLFGGLANCALIFILPVVFYLKLTGLQNKSGWELAWCALVVLFGVVGGACVAMYSILALKNDF